MHTGCVDWKLGKDQWTPVWWQGNVCLVCVLVRLCTWTCLVCPGCTHLSVSARTPDAGLFIFGCAHLFSVCVRVTLVAISVSDGQPHTQDMTADWQTDHQHSSQQSQRTLSGCQGHFMQDAGLIKIWNLSGGQMCSWAEWWTNKSKACNIFVFLY